MPTTQESPCHWILVEANCSVLQRGEVCCSVLQCVAVCCSVLHRVATALESSGMQFGMRTSFTFDLCHKAKIDWPHGVFIICPGSCWQAVQTSCLFFLNGRGTSCMNWVGLHRGFQQMQNLSLRSMNSVCSSVYCSVCCVCAAVCIVVLVALCVAVRGILQCIAVFTHRSCKNKPSRYAIKHTTRCTL
jgi:hypothetical protein